MSKISVSVSMAIALAWLGCGLAGAQAAVGGVAAPAVVAIPASHGTTLTGVEVALPDAVKGKVGVLVVGFTKDSKGELQAWGKRLAADYPDASGVAFYELPVLASAPKFTRVTIEEEMKLSLTAAERAHFVPLTENEAGWLAVAHYVKGDGAYVLLIGGDGTVRWQTWGPVTDANYAELKGKIGEMQAAMSAGAH
jgi:hypothetical protein